MKRLTQTFLIARQRWQQALTILRQEGLGVLLNRVILRIKRSAGVDTFGNFDRGYEQRRSQHPPLSAEQGKAIIDTMETKPLFSIIVPVYNVDTKWLTEMVESVQSQLYTNWQLCLVDDCSDDETIRSLLKSWAESDPRIRVNFNERNQGIAITSNNVLALAEGDYIALLDHDDELSIDALLENARLINQHPDAELIYSDEDKVSINSTYSTPFFKSDFSPDLLRSQNYIGHFVVMKKTLVDDIGGFNEGYDGAQDYDLLLRATEKTENIFHIPKVLYHWRQIPGSTAMAFGAKSHAWERGRKALEQHCQRQHIPATVHQGKYPGTYRVQYEIIGQPLVSIIIPFKDQAGLLDSCLESIFKHTQWPNMEILAIDNNSEQPETRETMEKWKQKESRIRFLSYPHPFNFSAINNFGVEQAKGEYVVFMNNDIEVTSPGCLESLLEHAQRENTGAVGAKLFYPNNTIQHAGVVIGIGGGAGHPFKHFPADHPGYFMRLQLVHNVSAVTAALMMIKRDQFLEVNGFDEQQFAIAYNDVDLCLKLMEKGYRNILTPHCTAIHHESQTRGYEIESDKKLRHDEEKTRLQKKWKNYLKQGDPFYSPNLTLQREDYSLRT